MLTTARYPVRALSHRFRCRRLGIVAVRVIATDDLTQAYPTTTNSLAVIQRGRFRQRRRGAVRWAQGRAGTLDPTLAG